ncbi:MAG TPA: choice-of-anchor Q domain-containing protein, partial [Longimicrobiales bacterium]|nr:choice-of-anchor Q domain-containing protein [Longimicrobiales bacterium]
MRIQAASALLAALLLTTACEDMNDPAAPVTRTPSSLVTTGDWVVNALDDVFDADGCTAGHCSLREAVRAAVDGEHITFGVTGTIQLSAPGMPLERSIVIAGPGAEHLTIAAAAIGTNYGHFVVRPEATVAISGIRLTGGVGTAGGSINNFGALALEAVEIAGNSGGFGGGIASTGTLTIVRSMIRDNVASRTGGGIYSEGTLTIDGSDMIANHVQSALASGGGGVRNNTGTLVVRDSRFEDNVVVGSPAQGGALESSGESAHTLVLRTLFTGNEADGGGAIFNDRAAMEIRESTIDGNHARRGRGGAIISQEGSLDVANTLVRFNTATAPEFGAVAGSTIFGHDASVTLRHVGVFMNTLPDLDDGAWGAAVLNGGSNASLQLFNSIVAGNLNGPEQFDVAAIDAGADIRGNVLGVPFPLLTGLDADNSTNISIVPGDWEASFGLAAASPAGAIARYTVLPGSPVIDRGVDDGCMALDLAGTPRPQGAACDAGPIEFVPIADLDGPVASALSGALHPVAAGMSIDFSGLVHDAATGGSVITGAEASLDGFTTTIALDAGDGAFDSPSEHVRGSFAAPADAGIHDLCLRGTDEAGNVG